LGPPQIDKQESWPRQEYSQTTRPNGPDKYDGVADAVLLVPASFPLNAVPMGGKNCCSRLRISEAVMRRSSAAVSQSDGATALGNGAAALESSASFSSVAFIRDPWNWVSHGDSSSLLRLAGDGCDPEGGGSDLAGRTSMDSEQLAHDGSRATCTESSCVEGF
jgi:hypothetical protein